MSSVNFVFVSFSRGVVLRKEFFRVRIFITNSCLDEVFTLHNNGYKVPTLLYMHLNMLSPVSHNPSRSKVRYTTCNNY